jgi:putative sterol carrier protein
VVAVDAFSNEWAQQFKDEINRSTVYRQAARGWRWTVGLVVEAEPNRNFPESRGIVMDLVEGEARDIKVGSADEARACDFVITAPYSRWKQVATKELDATRGMLQGKLKLKGDLPTIVRYTKASQEMTDPGSGHLARRLKAVDYAEGEEASPFGQMLGGLIEANVESRPEKRADFERLRARVGVFVTDIEEGVTLEFQGGHLLVHNGLQPARDLTIRADAGTVMQLSNVRIGFAGMPNYLDSAGREVVAKMLRGKLRIEGIMGNLTTLNQVTRLFSVQGGGEEEGRRP